MADPGSPEQRDTSGEPPVSWAARRRLTLLAALRPAFTATGLILAYYLLPMDETFNAGTVTGLVVGLIGVVALFTRQIRAIAHSAKPRLRGIETLATTVPLFLLLFSTTYYLLERSEPESFSSPLTRTDALYFTLTVFSTVGFGDITARSQVARIVTMLQMTMDILIVGVAVQLVVAAVKTGVRRQAGTDLGGGPGLG